ncbi:membrane protein [Streptomyces sp. MUSC 125]|uniref:hypothetical protein n=1 Tax=Streptomyces sp. MUSC 125 TaxID=1428624 RepID=UPI00057C9741|nr:hypothetical protein [Streptomyces sp. MUSC 125]KIE24993.1 membrane protein [Streptomyces sp. MUSC 125]
MNTGEEQGYTTDYGDTGHTRTRLPESNPYGSTPRRPGRSSSRGLITVVGVVVLLIAAIAFANRGGGSSTDGSSGKGSAPQTSSTAASGTRPVDTKSGGIPSGFAHTKQGAQSAAANYAVVLGSDGMFNTARRHEIVQSIADPNSVSDLQSGFDADYSDAFLKKVGLNDDGSAPKGSTFVNRTMPIGSKVTSFSASGTTVEVWCNGLFGIAGDTSTNPVTSSWFTVSMKLTWSNGDWRILESSQKTGPTPVSSDNPVSGANEISKAIQEFGGFTYAR